jgi:hypothetical protein
MERAEARMAGASVRRDGMGDPKPARESPRDGTGNPEPPVWGRFTKPVAEIPALRFW